MQADQFGYKGNAVLLIVKGRGYTLVPMITYFINMAEDGRTNLQ